MLPQQHLYNGLTRLANYSIFALEWTEFLPVQNGLARTVGGWRTAYMT